MTPPFSFAIISNCVDCTMTGVVRASADDFLPEELRDELTGYDAIISVEMIEL